jgi:UDP-glucose:(heptosyl)LPS alpha-1,3-glucosyltransferase
MGSSALGRSASRHIVQAARTIGPGFGVSGPAFQLERAFQALGCTTGRFTLADLCRSTERAPSASPPIELWRFWRDIVVFSTAGSLALWWRFRRRGPRTVVICQVDALYGDLFVVRSLHKAFLERHPARRVMMLRNPLHAFVLLRDRIRFTLGIHRHFVALSQGNKDDIVRLYGVPASRITVIANGVDLDRFQPSADARQSVRRLLSLPPDGLVAIFVGHEFERKGLTFVLDALAQLARRNVDISLIVAGGDSPDRFRTGSEDVDSRVRFVGHRSDIERYYAAADVFVMPASFDISPLAGLEALASGLPILITDLGGVREYLRDNFNGWFVRPDAGDIASKLERLAADPVLRRAMSANARVSVIDRGWMGVARQMLDLIDRVLPLPAVSPTDG